MTQGSKQLSLHWKIEYILGLWIWFSEKCFALVFRYCTVRGVKSLLWLDCILPGSVVEVLLQFNCQLGSIYIRNIKIYYEPHYWIRVQVVWEYGRYILWSWFLFSSTVWMIVYLYREILCNHYKPYQRRSFSDLRNCSWYKWKEQDIKLYLVKKNCTWYNIKSVFKNRSYAYWKDWK